MARVKAADAHDSDFFCNQQDQKREVEVEFFPTHDMSGDFFTRPYKVPVCAYERIDPKLAQQHWYNCAHECVGESKNQREGK